MLTRRMIQLCKVALSEHSVLHCAVPHGLLLDCKTPCESDSLQC